jgi:predicted transcriptional regulator
LVKNLKYIKPKLDKISMKTITQIKATLKIQKALLKEIEDDGDESQIIETRCLIDNLEWVLEI